MSQAKVAGRIVAAMLLASSALLDAPTVRAQTSDPDVTAEADGKRKINLSGRQRMLSQYMAKSACFISLNVNKDVEEQELRLAHHLFDETLQDLRKGSGIQQMLPEGDPAILAALDVVKARWDAYGPAVLKRDMAAITRLSLDVLSSSNDAVTLFQKKYGASGSISPEAAAAINISGRQRMLTQKASKEFCLIASNRDVAASRSSLKATVALFERSMQGLRAGDAELGTKASDVGTIIDQIDRAHDAWGSLKAIFDRIADGGAPTASDIETVSRSNIQVMQEMNSLVELYEAISD